ncbi:DUF2087 domain-containing protein [Citricoccus nitrophenolicus]|uniref:DUF2087 domain-containing protein n=1 Tax=Citricoccus nitrophenolicus TaxID=863575 RepID=A0ABV0IJF7_9MICC|nr:DUF2087 domain-containing protein [Citricoccus sp. I39-566]NUL46695.1 DUF2087 domain-containing protein [Cellulosimicrobium funkei]WMY78724.1 DUF2087 domain-containing protein [Citricoccus sp. I39-566]
MSDPANTPATPAPVTPPDWKPILAALGNEAARAVFALATLGELDADTRSGLNAKEQKSVAGWLALGVLTEQPDGSVTVDGAAVRAPLTALAASGTGKARAGVGRFLVAGHGPRIEAMPAAPAERADLLTWVRDHALAVDEVLTESQLNQRLHVFHPDVAMLRRYLVDASLLERTAAGTEYAIPADSRIS